MCVVERGELVPMLPLHLTTTSPVARVDELRVVVYADRATVGGDAADHRVRHIARMIGERARG